MSFSQCYTKYTHIQTKWAGDSTSNLNISYLVSTILDKYFAW